MRRMTDLHASQQYICISDPPHSRPFIFVNRFAAVINDNGRVRVMTCCPFAISSCKFGGGGRSGFRRLIGPAVGGGGQTSLVIVGRQALASGLGSDHLSSLCCNLFKYSVHMLLPQSNSANTFILPNPPLLVEAI